MKKSTLLTATLAVATLTAGAQTPAAAQLQKAQQAVRAFLSPTKAPQKAAAKASQKVYTPSSASTSTYNNGSWDYAYDTEYTYDANQNITQTVTKNGDTYLEKFTYTYDPTTPSLLITVDHQTWQESLNGWGEAENLFTNTVTRNADGKITALNCESYGYDDQSFKADIALTYGSDGTATNVEATLTEDGQAMTLAFSDIVWKETDGNYDIDASIFEDFSCIMEGNNRIESATVSMSTSGVSIPGTLTTTYADDAWAINLKFTYTYLYYRLSINMGYSKEYTDANGSYKLAQTYYDGSDAEYYAEAVTLDEYGSITQTDVYEGTNATDATLSESEKNAITYTDGLPVKVITSTLSGDDYVPTTKVEYEYDPTGIECATNAVSAASKAVYDLRGTMLGHDTETLPSGLYIVRDGHRTYKMLKR